MAYYNLMSYYNLTALMAYYNLMAYYTIATSRVQVRSEVRIDLYHYNTTEIIRTFTCVHSVIPILGREEALTCINFRPDTKLDKKQS